MVDTANVLERLAEPATDRQLRYAANLGESVRGDETHAEIAMKIEMGELAAGYREPAPSSDAINSARYFGLFVMRGMTSADIMRTISQSLLAPGREFDLARWYVFRVCKQHRIWAWSAVTSPDHWLVLQIAQEVLVTPKVFMSVQREANNSGLAEFSSTRDDAGLYGSSNTPAYRFVLDQIRLNDQNR